MSTPSDLCFYILMRNDLASMNPGKAVAQGGHAVSMFVEHVARHMILQAGKDWNPGVRLLDMTNAYEEWSGDRGFGTKITLGMNEREINSTLNLLAMIADATPVCVFDKVVDPSYPLRDGEFLHLIPLMTCAWVFGNRTFLKPILDRYSLYP